MQAAKRIYVPLSDSLQFRITSRCSSIVNFDPEYSGNDVSIVYLPFSVSLCHVMLSTADGL